MPARKKQSGVRSGRFKIPAATEGSLIIPKTKSAALYRIYNGGEPGFEVELCLPNGNPATPRVKYPVAKNGSVDLQVAANRTLKIVKLNLADDVEGIYESLDAQRDLRSGRFKIAAVAAPVPTKIIVGVSGRIYRVLNSGTNAITISGSVSAPIPVLQNCSSDVYVDNADVAVAGLANQAIQGVYDQLSDDAAVRSGRFRGTVNTKIIDFSASNGQGKYSYRIYNSGSNPFNVVATDSATTLATVTPNNSVDIEVNSANQTIEAQTANAALIDGAYEFLGS